MLIAMRKNVITGLYKNWGYFLPIPSGSRLYLSGTAYSPSVSSATFTTPDGASPSASAFDRLVALQSSPTDSPSVAWRLPIRTPSSTGDMAMTAAGWLSLRCSARSSGRRNTSPSQLVHFTRWWASDEVELFRNNFDEKQLTVKSIFMFWNSDDPYIRPLFYIWADAGPGRTSGRLCWTKTAGKKNLSALGQGKNEHARKKIDGNNVVKKAWSEKYRNRYVPPVPVPIFSKTRCKNLHGTSTYLIPPSWKVSVCLK